MKTERNLTVEVDLSVNDLTDIFLHLGAELDQAASEAGMGETTWVLEACRLNADKGLTLRLRATKPKEEHSVNG